MKMGTRFCTAIVALAISSSCGGGSLFVPAVGPFTGEFVVEGEVIGDFNLTTTNDLLGGTGTITHNNQAVNVTISASIIDRRVSGTVRNASLGSGTFIGEFTDKNSVIGQFNYQDIGMVSITTGTWAAAIPDGNPD